MISPAKVAARMKLLGFDIYGRLAPSYIPKNGMSEDDFRLLEHAVNALGADNVQELILNFDSFTASRQQLRRQARTHTAADIPPALALIKTFSGPLERFLNSNSIDVHGYRMVLHRVGDAPFCFRVELFSPMTIDQSRNFIATLNFDLFLNPRHEPCIVLGNLQGGSKEDFVAFKTQMKMDPFDFLIRGARDGFTPHHSVAFNPVKFKYFDKLGDMHVAVSMVKRNKITRREASLFDQYLKFLRRTFAPDLSRVPDDAHAVASKVQLEKQRIRREGIAKHSAYFQKHGFQKTQSTRWRIKKHSK